MTSTDERCRVCGGPMRNAFHERVLGRHDVQYFSCGQCGHFRTEAPHWLDEAYSHAIAAADTGIVMRNLQVARRLACILDAFFDPRGRYLDTAGGTGLLTRLMRDVGFDFYWQDPYCENLLARGFEATGHEGGFEAVTAIEALEHMPDPMAFLRSSVERSQSGSLLFTTELFEGEAPAPDWWYFAYPTGQHISFFSRRTLEYIAGQLGVRFVTAYGLHLFTRRDVSERQYHKVVRKAERGLFERVAKRMQGLTQADHARMLERARR